MSEARSQSKKKLWMRRSCASLKWRCEQQSQRAALPVRRLTCICCCSYCYHHHHHHHRRCLGAAVLLVFWLACEIIMSSPHSQWCTLVQTSSLRFVALLDADGFSEDGVSIACTCPGACVACTFCHFKGALLTAADLALFQSDLNPQLTTCVNDPLVRGPRMALASCSVSAHGCACRHES